MTRARMAGPLFVFGTASSIALACSGAAFNDAGSGQAATAGTDSVPTDSVHRNPKSGSGKEPLSAPSLGDVGGVGGAPVESEPVDMGIQPPPNGGTAGNDDSRAGAPDVAGAGDGGAGAAGSVIETEPLPVGCTPIVEDWTEPLQNGGTWNIEWGDPYVDSSNHRLVLSYDDVAQRNSPYVAGYYVEGDVTIAGNVAFTPYPYVDEVLLPTLRRGDRDFGLQLGATIYGVSRGFELSGWGSVSGAIVSVATKVHFASFVQATSKAFAVRIGTGDAVYRSDWVRDFHWAGTNLGIMRFVGENNSGGTEGGGLIFVDTLRGCQDLDDDTIKKLFEQ